MGGVQIGGMPRDNGLYLEKFETREEAEKYIKELGRKYQYAPDQSKVSLRKLQRYAKNEGVEIHINQLSTWFKELGIKIRRRGGKGRPITRPSKTFTIDEEVLERVTDFKNQSYIAELGLKIVMRIPTEDLLVMLPVESDEDPINIIFKKERESYKAIATGKLRERDKKMIAGLLKRANSHGLEPVKEYLNLFGYRHYGGDKTYSDTKEE